MNLQDIKNRHYEGYLWYSDQERPLLVNGNVTLPKGNNPYIQEGMLWCKEEQISIMIRHTGRYQIGEFDLNELEKKGAKLEPEQYLAHKLDFSELKFYQLWELEEDPLCAGYQTYKQKAIIFAGFIK